ncbi:MAG: mevalonate kinase [Spirochaetota bacterium]
MIVKAHAYPRAALIGNPSDGYFGKTIAFTFSNYQADVTIYDTEQLEILPARRDHSRFASLRALADDVRSYGYYGGIRIIKAALKRFHDYCTEHALELHDRNFSVRYHSSIPPHLGLAGSSAIITACMRALQAFYGVEIPKPRLANLVLSVETDELSIGAGLQDRVAQVYGGIVHMDFDRAHMDEHGYGVYTPLTPDKFPNLYVGFNPTFAEGTEIVHNDLRYRWENGDRAVHEAMKGFAELTDRFRSALEREEYREVDEIINANFDLRSSIMNLNPNHVRMVETARSVGASAKYTGSGGAIIGAYADDEMFARLQEALGALGAQVIRPEIS